MEKISQCKLYFWDKIKYLWIISPLGQAYCPGSPHPLWPEVRRRAEVGALVSLPTRYERLSILLHVTRKTSHRRRTTSPSCIKWQSYVFREWVGPLANKWSAMVASTLFTSKIFFFTVWKIEGRRTCSRRLGQSFIDFPLNKTEIWPESTSLYIKWHFYHRLQLRTVGFLRHHRTRCGEAKYR